MQKCMPDVTALHTKVHNSQKCIRKCVPDYVTNALTKCIPDYGTKVHAKVHA